MDEKWLDTIIVSDLHLGAEVSRARDAVEMLKQHRFRRLILLGDIFSDLNFRRLKKQHWQFLGHIRKLSNPKRNVEVVWVEGNHDQGLSTLMAHLVGVEVFQEYAWEFRGQKFLAVHGHQFDRFAVNNALLSNLGAFLFMQLQKLDFERKTFSRFLDRFNTAWLRMSPKVAAGALAFGKDRGADVVICGHTHEALEMQKDGVRYLNSGAWINARPTYITVGAEGVQIREYIERADDRDSGEERGEADSGLADFVDEAGLSADAEHAGVCC